ncbi:MAG TPA: Yip1 family protein [Bryobacteraceae bacterium]|jgi:hypothetical protein|nr:Yip1 family protein [Bryobacteraceae bacterium]
MSTDVTSPLETEPKPMNEFSRILGVFFEPTKTFADIAERPRWLVPLLLVILAGAAYLYAFGAHVGWASYLHRLLDNNPNMQRVPADQRQRIFDMQVRFASVGGVVNVAIGTVLMYLIGGGIAMGVIKGLLGVPIGFKQTFAAFSYGSLPRVISSALAIVVVFLKNPEDFDLQNPFMSNFGALMDPDKSSKFLYSLASSMDLFSFWVILLTATGLKAAGGKRLSFGGALFAVVLPWVFWVLIRGALSAMGMMG